jgi:16S rRNA (cytidine1402-2'-O)-methyltransferase
LPGTLYIVATPIGNLEDITFRAVRILREADLIACEDTRQTQKLLSHYGISKRMVSYHEHNEQSRSEELIAELQSGKNIALVTDAGTPLISDPGYRLVAGARMAGVPVSPIPGPGAFLAALSASGLGTDSFVFLGFLPAKKTQRRRVLENWKASPATLICYEAPHRIVEALEDIDEILGEREVVLARELTKIHEEFLRGTPREVMETLRERPALKGEITLMVAKRETPEPDDRPLEAAVEELVQAGVSRMDALKTVAKRRGLSKREVYKKVVDKPKQ